MSTENRCRVLFVGMDLSPVSIHVLAAISAEDEFEVLPVASRRPGTIGRAWREYGWRTVARGGLYAMAAKWRMLLRAVGIRRTSGFRSLREVAAARGLELTGVPRINAAETVERFKAFAPDLLLVAACDQILKKQVLDVPRQGCVNVHPSLLPAYRGPKPCYWVREAGETTTGVTFHVIDEGIDTGPILAQRELAIAKGESEPRLRHRCGVLAGEMAVDVVRGVRDGTLVARPQPEEGASYQGKPPWGRSRL